MKKEDKKQLKLDSAVQDPKALKDLACSTDESRLNRVAQTIFDKKGMNILALDVRGISTMTDYFLIAEGSVARHVSSLAAAIKHEMNEVGVLLLQSEGENDSEWVVMDYGHIVIHLFTPDMREKYRIEEVWSQSKLVDVFIDITSNSKVYRT